MVDDVSRSIAGKGARAGAVLTLGSLSVIIPARNDAAALRATLDWLDRLPGRGAVEVVVAASGAQEETTAAAGARARLLWPPQSTRAGLMNAGAAAARGEVLLFLHADSFLPVDAFARIDAALTDPRVVGGAFEHAFVERTWGLTLISWINRIRYRLRHTYYGDQGIFARTDVFRALGGYRNVRLMEDYDLSLRLKRAGRLVLIASPLRTSGRRFLTRGTLRTVGFITWILTLHTLGFDVERYAERWRGPAGRAPGSRWAAES